MANRLKMAIGVRSAEHIFDWTAWLVKLALISSEEVGHGEQAAGSG